MTVSTKLVVCLTLVPAVFAQFFGATGRSHPLYGQASPFADALAIMALGGLGKFFFYHIRTLVFNVI